MRRQNECRAVLNAEMKRWAAMPCDQLVAELGCTQGYEVEYEGRRYQVEVILLENTDRYVHAGVSVDDGSFFGSFHPLSDSFIRQKAGEV